MLFPGRGFALGWAAVAGVTTGVTGSFVHGLSSYGVPVGLILAVAVTAATFAVAGALAGSRLGAGVAVTAWLLPVLFLSTPRGGGDLVIAGTPAGYAWLIAGAVVSVVSIARPYASETNSASRVQNRTDSADETEPAASPVE